MSFLRTLGDRLKKQDIFTGLPDFDTPGAEGYNKMANMKYLGSGMDLPNTGDIVQGYRYMGGDIGQMSSWQEATPAEISAANATMGYQIEPQVNVNAGQSNFGGESLQPNTGGFTPFGPNNPEPAPTPIFRTPEPEQQPVYTYGPSGPAGTNMSQNLDKVSNPDTIKTNTGTNNMANSPAPYAAGITTQTTGLDGLTKQLLFGLDGKGGFIPGAMRAAEKTFYDDQGNVRVVPEQVADFTADQIRAQELGREGIGIQDPYLQQAQAAYGSGIGMLDQGFDIYRQRAQQGLDRTLGGLGEAEAIARGSTLGYGNRLGESEDLYRDTVAAYDPTVTQQYMDPYEQSVVDQTSKDLMEQYSKSDIEQRARDIMGGGSSAFGARAGLGAQERTEALGRGLAEAIGGIRSRGFQQAQNTGMAEFARQQAAKRAAAGGLGTLAGQRFSAGTGLGSTLANYGQAAGSAYGNIGSTEGQIGQQRQAAQFGLAGNLQGLGAQAQGARSGDISQLYNLGGQQQQLSQAQLDAQRRNQLTAQQAPLAQYQAVSPFISMVPAGQFSSNVQYTPPPSPVQAGLAAGLGGFGMVGNFLTPPK